MALVVNIVFLMINVVFMTAAYFIIKYKFEKKLFNQEILSQVKKEMNHFLININEATLNNVTIIETKISKLNQVKVEAESKIKLLQKKVRDVKSYEENFHSITGGEIKRENELFPEAYNPQKIVNQIKVKTDNKNKSKNDADLKKDVLKKLENLTLEEKVYFLNEKGFSKDEIRQELKLENIEFDLLLNVKGIKI